MAPTNPLKKYLDAGVSFTSMTQAKADLTSCNARIARGAFPCVLPRENAP